MPHVIIKLWPGRSEETKKAIAEKVSKAVIESAGVPEGSVSVAIEEIQKEKWEEEVRKPDIQIAHSKVTNWNTVRR